MSRKDYIVLANALKPFVVADQGGDYSVSAVEVAQAVADVLAADNGSFDRGRFLKACGVDNG